VSLQFLLYTKPACPLCQEAIDLLNELARELPFTWTEVNILTSLDLYETFRHEIPVLCCGEKKIFVHRINPNQLATFIQQHS
jgi:glutaredoxin